MDRSLGLLSGLLTATFVAGGALAFGCATGVAADLTPDIDPSLPAVDATYNPLPAQGGQKPSGAESPSISGSDSASSSGGNTAKDAGTSVALPADAGAAHDAAPLALDKPSPNEVVITEVMYDTLSSEPDSEWIELHSVASVPRLLNGLTLRDGGGRTHLIAGTLTIAPGAYVVLARSTAGALAAKVPSTVIVYEYGPSPPSGAGVQLANGASGGVALLNGSVIISQSPYGGWYSQSGGSSLQLRVIDGARATAKASWCLSSKAWTTGSDKGSPGAAADCT